MGVVWQNDQAVKAFCEESGYSAIIPELTVKASGSSKGEFLSSCTTRWHQSVTSSFRLFPVLCTTPETFRQQVEWLQRHLEVISMDEAERRLREAYRQRRASGGHHQRRWVDGLL